VEGWTCDYNWRTGAHPRTHRSTKNMRIELSVGTNCVQQNKAVYFEDDESWGKGHEPATDQVFSKYGVWYRREIFIT